MVLGTAGQGDGVAMILAVLNALALLVSLVLLSASIRGPRGPRRPRTYPVSLGSFPAGVDTGACVGVLGKTT